MKPDSLLPNLAKFAIILKILKARLSIHKASPCGRAYTLRGVIFFWKLFKNTAKLPNVLALQFGGGVPLQKRVKGESLKKIKHGATSKPTCH